MLAAAWTAEGGILVGGLIRGLARVWRVVLLFGVLGLAAGQVQRVAAPSSAVLAGDDVKTGGGGMG